MTRMDKYEEIKEDAYSRTKKNEDLYKDVYLNNTLVDLNKIINEESSEIELETKEEILEIKEIYYEEKNYDLAKFLDEKRRQRVQDNLPRSLSDDLKKSDDEISELLLKIEQKDSEEDLFKELLPDYSETTILNTQEEKENLNNFVSDEVINNFVMNKDLSETNGFMDLEETKIIEKKKVNHKKKNKLPIIVFSTTLLLLIISIIYLLIIKVF